MSDQSSTEPLSFVRWLHAQAKGDAAREMPYARIYQWGKHIHEAIGADGRFEGEWIATELARQGADADALAALVAAEAAWRVDTLVERAEDQGIDLGMPTESETETSKALETADPKVLCGFRNHRGEGCTNAAIPGAGRCGTHGGSITDPEVRRSFLLVAFAKMFDGARVAVETLLDVAENSNNDMARVKAAQELLDRVGVQQDQHVHIHAQEMDTSEDELVNALRNRMLETKNRLRLTAIEVAESEYVPVPNADHEPLALRRGSDDDIIDADIVEH